VLPGRGELLRYAYPIVTLYMGSDDAFGFQFIPSGMWTINGRVVQLTDGELIPDRLKRQTPGEFMFMYWHERMRETCRAKIASIC